MATETTHASLTATSYLEWGAVLGGSAVALAISGVLVQFGSGIGLALSDSPTLDSGEVSWNVLLVGLWVVLVALASSSAGGYLAGRMRGRFHDGTIAESEFRDGAHGLVAWAVATAVTLFIVALMAALAALAAAAVEPGTDPAIEAEIARMAANSATIYNFASAAGAALGAAGAWFGAIAGGQHRNEGTAIFVAMPAWARPRS